MQQILKSVIIALHNIRANPLHTFLSTLGIVIGVASLVAILALGDGLEETGRQQIESTTSLQMISVTSKQWEVKNNIRVPLDTVLSLTLSDKKRIEELTGDRGVVELLDQGGMLASYGDSVLGITVYGNTENGKVLNNEGTTGRFFTHEEVTGNSQVIFISGALASEWGQTGKDILGKHIMLGEQEFTVIGVSESLEGPLAASIPITLFQEMRPGRQYPQIMIKANSIEHVPVIKEETENWLSEQYPEWPGNFAVNTNKARVEQFNKGILAFKLVMGAITGISVLVGGIGVMNVLLISVTERTKEIGIRKATGARKKDIILQFMSESVTISLVGCMFGWVLGILGVFAFVPVVNYFAGIGFNAAVSVGSVIAVLIIAILVGIIFGTYPAWRAAQLTPVDAIRHE